jgi:phospholipid/cholesterol/gamma-HCH transport system ATP-binding protein
MTPAANSKLIARMEDVSLAFGERVVLRNCSLNIVEGAITCIIGLTGAGKSTILRLIDGLLLPDAGHVYVRGEDICHMNEEQLNRIRQKISLSFQFSALLDSLTVGQNVALPLQEHTQLSEAEIRRLVMDSLESVGLTNAYDNLPAELSGGMLKRAGAHPLR